jgi:flagellar basal-body rod protein FlgC
MNYFSAFSISASGMSVEKTRVDVAAVNLANIHSTRSAAGGGYKPLRVVSGERPANAFSNVLQGVGDPRGLNGAEVVAIAPLDVEPRMVHEPGHPDADEKGYVRYPRIDQTAEMLTLVTAMRAYEANLVAMSAARTMATRALEIGDQR